MTIWRVFRGNIRTLSIPTPRRIRKGINFPLNTSQQWRRLGIGLFPGSLHLNITSGPGIMPYHLGSNYF